MSQKFFYRLEMKLLEKISFFNVDGLANIVRANNVIAFILWLIIFVASISATLYLIVSAVSDFLRYDVSSTVRYLTEERTVLPTVTFCNINPFTTEYAINLLGQANVTMPHESETVDYWAMYLQVEDYLRKTRGYALTLDEKFKLANMSALMHRQTDKYDGYFEVLTGYESEDGQVERFTQIFVPRYFNCLVFNSESALSVDSADFGLKGLLIAGGEDDYVTNMFSGNMRGFYMFLHNSTDFLYEIARPVIILSAGYCTQVNIDRHFYHQYEYPYSECGVLEDNSLVINLADRSIFDKVIATNSSYTRQTCLAFCTQMLTARRCGCQSNRLALNSTSVAYCSMRDELGCAATVWNSSRDIDEACPTLGKHVLHFALKCSLLADAAASQIAWRLI